MDIRRLKTHSDFFMTTPSDASSALKACIDGSRTLLRELEKAGKRPPEELIAVQDLLECIDRNAEQIALALAGSRRRKTSDGVGAIAGLLHEQDQFFQQVRHCALCVYYAHAG